MRTRTIVAGLVVGLLATYAPVATAGHAIVGCRMNSLSQATATGQDTWEGVAEGYVIGNTGEAVSVRCVVRVNGAVRAATNWGNGTTAATTADRVTYIRTLTEVAQLCAQYVTGHGPGETCFDVSTTAVPPPEVYDVLVGALDLVDEVGPGAGVVVLQGLPTGQTVVLSSPNIACGDFDGTTTTCSRELTLPCAGATQDQCVTTTTAAAAAPAKCDAVYVTAELVPDTVSSVTGVTRCGNNLTASVTAGPVVQPASASSSGSGVHPIGCERHLTGDPIMPRVTCSYSYVVR